MCRERVSCISLWNRTRPRIVVRGCNVKGLDESNASRWKKFHFLTGLCMGQGAARYVGRRWTVLYEFSGQKKKRKKMHPKPEFKKSVQFNHPMEPSKAVSDTVECFSRSAYTYQPLDSTEIWIFQFNNPLIGTRVYHYTTIAMINCYYCMQL